MDGSAELHETKVIVFNRRDDWQANVTCKCGWKETSVGESSAAAGARASARGRAHVQQFHGAGAVAAHMGTTVAGLALFVLIAAIPVMLIVGVVNLFVGGDDAGSDERSSYIENGSDIDCDKAVTQMMEREYGGGWGSGAWPNGEYPRRVKECEGD